MIREAILKIVDKQDLTYEEAYEVMSEIMSGETTATQNSAFLAALSTKNATVDTINEIWGCAAAMREHSLCVSHPFETLEIVGTGGDSAHTFNISTTSAFVVASSGVKVAKHGNRAASSKCGAADCLEALGANINLEPEKCVELLDKVGFCFFFAQKYHTSMKHVGAVRRELGIRTVFNILGPLTSPSGAAYEVMGVYDESLVEPLATVLHNLGVKRGMVVYGLDSLDEISMSSPTSICEINGTRQGVYQIKPEDFGYKTCDKSELRGGTPEENAQITRDILNGKDKGPKRQAVCLNAGAAIYIAGKAKDMEEGVKRAEELIDSGKAAQKLQQFIEETNK